MFLPDYVSTYQLRATTRGGVYNDIVIPISAGCRFEITPTTAKVLVEYEEGDVLDIYNLL